MMDKIEFRVVKASVKDFSKKADASGIPEREMDVIDIFINDKRLIDVVREVELPQAMKDQETGDKIAGSYVGFPYEKDWFLKREKIVKPYFLGRTDFSYERNPEEDGRSWTPLFTCAGCLEDGCWSLLAAIEPVEDLVLWTALSHNHRKHWDYSKVGKDGTFMFDRAQYEAALDKIA
jgi:hypothetical protein